MPHRKGTDRILTHSISKKNRNSLYQLSNSFSIQFFFSFKKKKGEFLKIQGNKKEKEKERTLKLMPLNYV